MPVADIRYNTVVTASSPRIVVIVPCCYRRMMASGPWIRFPPPHGGRRDIVISKMRVTISSQSHEREWDIALIVWLVAVLVAASLPLPEAREDSNKDQAERWHTGTDDRQINLDCGPDDRRDVVPGRVEGLGEHDQGAQPSDAHRCDTATC